MTDAVDRLIEQYGAPTVCAAMRPLLADERIQRIESVLSRRLTGLTVALENLHDPHNGAAAIRSIEAIGLTTLHVSEAVEPFHYSPAVTIGSEKWLELVHHPDIDACAAALRDAGFTLYAAAPTADLDLEAVDVSRPVAVIFGNEHAGLSDRALALCDHQVGIAMHGFTRSFNLSVSVAVATHRLAARRRHALAASGDLDGPKRDRLRARWYALGVRGAESILTRYVSEQTRGRGEIETRMG